MVGVAFLDVGVYVTSLRAVKNLLVLGDAIKSIWFVAFQVRPNRIAALKYSMVAEQEHPYKLVVLGKDPYHACVINADLFFADNRVSLLVGDEEGVVRIFEYDPHGKCRNSRLPVFLKSLLVK